MTAFYARAVHDACIAFRRMHTSGDYARIWLCPYSERMRKKLSTMPILSTTRWMASWDRIFSPGSGSGPMSPRVHERYRADSWERQWKRREWRRV